MHRPLALLRLLLGVALLMAVPLAAGAAAQAPRRHAIAKLGTPKFSADFKSFDWVNPDAPKGGTLRLSTVGNFDNVNVATILGLAAPGLTFLNDTLFAPSLDEPATAYGLIAEWASYPDDFSAVTFGLRLEARFHDGRPITVEDVIYSFEEQKRASPAVAIFYQDVVAAAKSAEREVTFRFARAGNRDLPYRLGLLAILPRHYWSAKDASGQPRELANTTLEPPLASGPYRIASIDVGRSIVYARVKDYWARDLPVNRGQYNFDEIRYIAYRDDVPQFEALKTGEIDFKEEYSSKKWATGYDFPAVKDGRVKVWEFETATVGQFQGFAFNTRRQRFADPRVRRAFALVYDFESANKSLFYGLYRRLNSYFDNSPLAQRGLPEGRELEILAKHRDTLPPEVFTTPYRSPLNATPEALRANLREASRLFAEAGWKADKGVLKNTRSGEAMTVEFLNYDTQFDRIVLPYKQNLEKLGIRVALRVVEPTQYENRMKDFDFDMIADAYPQSHAPGNELREYFGSESAAKKASRNRIGIKSPVVDAIIEEIIYATTREEMTAATRALDRVLLWGHYAVPQFFNPTNWYAYWDKFGRPARHASQDPSPVTTWWIDAAAAAKLEAANARR